jgi:hypothetical protein
MAAIPTSVVVVCFILGCLAIIAGHKAGKRWLLFSVVLGTVLPVLAAETDRLWAWVRPFIAPAVGVLVVLVLLGIGLRLLGAAQDNTKAPRKPERPTPRRRAAPTSPAAAPRSPQVGELPDGGDDLGVFGDE